MPVQPVSSSLAGSARWVRTLGVTGLLLGGGMFACSGGDERPRPAQPGSGGSSGSDAGGRLGTGGVREGGAGSSDANAGTTGTGADAGTNGDASGGGGNRDGGTDGDSGSDAPSVCGNGIIESDEACDGSDLDGQTCTSYGFDEGTLACDGCNIDIRGCRGQERCYDGRDNDGDFVLDCMDSDCAASCASSCSTPPLLADPATSVRGITNGHAAELTPSCLPSGTGSGSELVYRFVAAQTGMLDLSLTSLGPDLNISVRRQCSSAASELLCSEQQAGTGAVERLRVPIGQSDAVFIVIDGNGATEAGAFELSARSRVIRCGDGNRDTGEGCDDGNVDSNDGCSAQCVLERDETEPNGTSALANVYSATPLFASISPAGDVDMFKITVSPPNTTLTAEIFDLGDGACAKHELDSFVEIIASDGSTVLASDDDLGAGFCSSAGASGLQPGTYYVRVQASGPPATFPYALSVGASR